MKRWNSVEEMYRDFGESLSEEEYVKEVGEIKEFIGECEDYELLEGGVYDECFVVRKKDKYYGVDGNWDMFKFGEYDEEEKEEFIKLVG